MKREPVISPGSPKMIDDEMYILLREEKIAEFNDRRPREGTYALSGLDFRGLNLRGLDVDGIDFSNSYFRQADLAGLNLSNCNMEGASIGGANISGAKLPAQLSAQEIVMSLKYGTRLRYGA